MTDDIMAVDERVTKLEVTVAEGFHELDGRMDRLDGRMDRFEERMDAFNERLGLVLERLDLLSVEMRTTITAMTRESRADRRLMFAMLKDHRVRIEALETATRDSSDPSSGV